MNFPLWVLITLPIVLGLASFGIFYFFVERFINERLRILYRSIRKGKFVNAKMEDFKLTDDVFEQAEKEASTWVEEQNREISKLKEQEEFRREFLGNLAHELKTPVFSIQGYILTLLDGGLEDENVNRLFLERATSSIDRMVSLLEDLDAITKMEVNGLKLELENFDIRKLVQEIYDSLELQAREKQITLKFSKEYQAMPVHADKAKIAQVLTNLIANSIYYGNASGTTTARFFEMNDLILIEISDDGPGIDEQNLPRIFERFYRVEKSRTRNEGGSGLGLAIAKHAIEAHNQRLTVRSTLGLGSTFAFTLDKAKEKQENFVTSRGLKVR
ncbi:MAG: two-component sensor histidine kinase [Crocinitomicaceae bacterium]|nr:two-component sensor histidine kinase [Crocinitomicaceae bacterium]